MKHIALTIDRNFVRFCSVTMVSALINDRPSDITFHIVGNNLDQEDKERLNTVARNYGGNIFFYEVPTEMLEGYTLRWGKGRLSTVVFYRCCLASILPAEIDRVLYMDCDMLVLKPLDDLWNTPLHEVALAAAPDSMVPNPAHCARLGYAEHFNYFNGGLLLLNLAYWREHHLEQKCKEYYNRYPDRILMNDQDLLNGLLYDKKCLVDIQWNLQEGAYRIPQGEMPDFRPDYMELLRHPSVLHYSARKPWMYHCMHPLRELYFQYQDNTPWKGMHPLNSPWARVHRYFHLLPYSLHWKRRKYIDIS